MTHTDNEQVPYKFSEINFSLVFLIFILLLTPSVFSQNINLNSIEEFRYKGSKNNLLRLKMEVDDFEEDGSHFLRVQKVKTVVDDTGNKLAWYNSYSNQTQWGRNRFLNFNFRAPFRTATYLKRLSAVVEYFTVSKEKKSLLSIDNLMQKKEVNFLSNLDEEAKLILLDFEKLKELRGKAGYKAYIKKLYENLGIGNTLEEAEIFVENLFYFSYGDKGSHLFFFKKDPEDKVFKIDIFNGTGDKINTGYSYADEKIVIYLNEVPNENTRLKVIFEHEDAIDEIKFEFNNIVLP